MSATPTGPVTGTAAGTVAGTGTLAHVAETAVPEHHRGGERPHPARAGLGLLLRIVLCLVFGLPLLFMFVSSFKPDLQIFDDLGSINAFLPTGDISTANYTGVFGRVPFAQFMMNSVIITVVTVVLGILVNSMAAFALARIGFKGAGIVLGIILATLIVPFETLALPLLWWANQLPFIGPEAAARNASFTSSTRVSRASVAVRSTTLTVGVGTRRQKPSILPLRSGMTRPSDLAAPVVVGMMFWPALRARRGSLCATSRMRWSFV